MNTHVHAATAPTERRFHNLIMELGHASGTLSAREGTNGEPRAPCHGTTRSTQHAVATGHIPSRPNARGSQGRALIFQQRSLVNADATHAATRKIPSPSQPKARPAHQACLRTPIAVRRCSGINATHHQNDHPLPSSLSHSCVGKAGLIFGTVLTPTQRDASE